MFLGIVTSLIFSSMVAIMGEWFPKKIRGTVIGVWVTCINIGNIIGVQMASGLIKVFGEEKWYDLMFTVAGMMTFFAFIFLFFLKPDPESAGFHINEFSENDQPEV